MPGLRIDNSEEFGSSRDSRGQKPADTARKVSISNNGMKSNEGKGGQFEQRRPNTDSSRRATDNNSLSHSHRPSTETTKSNYKRPYSASQPSSDSRAVSDSKSQIPRRVYIPSNVDDSDKKIGK